MISRRTLFPDLADPRARFARMKVDVPGIKPEEMEVRVEDDIKPRGAGS